MMTSLVFPLLLSIAAVETSDCRIMTAARSAGEPVGIDDTAPINCDNVSIDPKLRYDHQTEQAVAVRDLAGGDMLGRVYLPPKASILPGDGILTMARFGHVQVSRELTALQPARAGQRFFARTADGKIIVAAKLSASARQ